MIKVIMTECLRPPFETPSLLVDAPEYVRDLFAYFHGGIDQEDAHLRDSALRRWQAHGIAPTNNLYLKLLAFMNTETSDNPVINPMDAVFADFASSANGLVSLETALDAVTKYAQAPPCQSEEYLLALTAALGKDHPIVARLSLETQEHFSRQLTKEQQMTALLAALLPYLQVHQLSVIDACR